MTEGEKQLEFSLEQPQSVEEFLIFKDEVANEIKETERDMSAEYGRLAPQEKRLAYHNEDHTFKDVLRRANILLNTIDTALRATGKPGISERDMCSAQLFVAYHDKVMETTIEEKEDGSRIRRRHSPANELNSVVSLTNKMEETNERLGSVLYTAADRRGAASGISVTVPTFQEGTVRQLELNNRSPLIAIAIAMADIGGAGMDGPKQLFKEASALFFEDNPDITEKVLAAQLSSAEDSRKESYKQRIISWFKSQGSFVRGRQECFREELDFLPKEARMAVGNLFNRFDDSIASADSIAAEFERLSLEGIIERMKPGLAIFYPEVPDGKKV